MRLQGRLGVISPGRGDEMKRYKGRFFLLRGGVALIFAILVVITVARRAGREAIDEAAFLSEVAPGAVFAEKRGSPPHYPSAAGVTAFNTYDAEPGIRGYNGPIKTLVALDREGRITGIRILEHRETKNYVHRLETREFLGQFLGKSVHDPFVVDRDIDGISRATVTVKALADSVRESSRRVAGEVMGLRVPGGKTRAGTGPGFIVYGTLLGAALAGYIYTRKRTGKDRLRDGVMIVSVFVVGLWLSTPFSLVHLLNLGLLQVSANSLWLIAVPGIIVVTVCFGRVYCGWLCPFGALTEFLGRLPFRKWRIPEDLDRTWRRAKYVILVVLIAAVIGTGRVDPANVETYVTLFSWHGTAPAWSLVLLMLFLSIVVERFWCRYFCPVAAVGALLSRTIAGYPSTPSCPMKNPPDPFAGECIRCNRCYRPPQSEPVP